MILPDQFNPAETYFLGIGVGDYVGKSNNHKIFANLPETVNDAQTLSKLMERRLGYQHVDHIVNDKASKTIIMQTLKGMAERVPSDGTAVIYFSGHGGRRDSDPEGAVYLLTRETTYENFDETAISGADLQQLFNLFKARSVLLIVDACYSGGIILKDKGPGLAPTRFISNFSVNAENLFQQATARLQAHQNRFLLASSPSNQTALIQPSASLSAFTAVLVDVLTEASQKGSPLTIFGLVHRLTEVINGHDNTRQVIIVKTDPNGVEDFIVANRFGPVLITDVQTPNNIIRPRDIIAPTPRPNEYAIKDVGTLTGIHNCPVTALGYLPEKELLVSGGENGLLSAVSMTDLYGSQHAEALLPGLITGIQMIKQGKESLILASTISSLELLTFESTPWYHSRSWQGDGIISMSGSPQAPSIVAILLRPGRYCLLDVSQLTGSSPNTGIQWETSGLYHKALMGTGVQITYLADGSGVLVCDKGDILQVCSPTDLSHEVHISVAGTITAITALEQRRFLIATVISRLDGQMHVMGHLMHLESNNNAIVEQSIDFGHERSIVSLLWVPQLFTLIALSPKEVSLHRLHGIAFAEVHRIPAIQNYKFTSIAAFQFNGNWWLALGRAGGDIQLKIFV